MTTTPRTQLPPRLLPVLSAAAWCLLAASLFDTVNVIRILRYAFQTPSSARL